MFGLEMQDKLVDDYMHEEFTPRALRTRGTAFSADSKSQFQAMLEHKDKEVVEMFRKCEDLELPISVPSKKALATDIDESLPLDQRHNQLIQRGLRSMDKRIRQMFTSKVASNIYLIEFVWEIEQLLFAQNSIEEGLEEYKPNVAFWKMFLQDPYAFFSEDVVSLRFLSSLPTAFLRLLVHGICQFHHVKSVSHAVRGNVSDKVLMLKKAPTKACSRSLQERLSLAMHLLMAMPTPSSSGVEAFSEASVSSELDFQTLLKIKRTHLRLPLDNTSSETKTDEDASGLSADFVLVDIRDFDVVVDTF